MRRDRVPFTRTRAPRGLLGWGVHHGAHVPEPASAGGMVRRLQSVPTGGSTAPGGGWLGAESRLAIHPCWRSSTPVTQTWAKDMVHPGFHQRPSNGQPDPCGAAICWCTDTHPRDRRCWTILRMSMMAGGAPPSAVPARMPAGPVMPMVANPAPAPMTSPMAARRAGASIPPACRSLPQGGSRRHDAQRPRCRRRQPRPSRLLRLPEGLPGTGQSLPFAAQVSDGRPWQIPNVGEQDRDRVAAELPAAVVVESLGYYLAVKAVDGHSSSRGHSQHQVAVGITDDQVADEPGRYGALQCIVPLVIPDPPLGELLHLPSGVAGGHEVHPVGAWGQLVGERVQGGGPGYGCLGRHSDPALDQDHERVTSLCVPFGRGLPACRVRLGRRIYETR